MLFTARLAGSQNLIRKHVAADQATQMFNMHIMSMGEQSSVTVHTQALTASKLAAFAHIVAPPAEQETADSGVTDD